MWTPDVYEGAPTPVTAFLATAAKAAAVAVTVRIVITAFPGAEQQWRQIIIFLAIASTLLGSFAAIGQTNIKRLMAYSSIGHMGFALIGLASGNELGIRGVAIYLAIYLVMTLGAFAAILAMRVEGKSVENISDLAGLSRTNGLMAFFLAMLMFSLAGIPPLAGFLLNIMSCWPQLTQDFTHLQLLACWQVRWRLFTICALSRLCILMSLRLISIHRHLQCAPCSRYQR